MGENARDGELFNRVNISKTSREAAPRARNCTAQ